MFLVLANATSDGRIRLDRYPELHAAALVSLNFLIFVVSLDPKCSVYRFLDLYPTRSIICYSDAAGWEKSVRNPSPGCIGGYFDAPDFVRPFAFAIPWYVFRAYLPSMQVFVRPHINYLELMGPIILIVWLALFYPTFVRGRRFIIKIDSRVAQA